MLLTFPAIQVCENGEELAWISGDPADEYPAPRVLVLPPGSEPAATLDDVPLDAPGRDQLVAVVDVDNPNAHDDDRGTDHHRGGHDDHGGRRPSPSGRTDRHDGGAAGNDRRRDARSSEHRFRRRRPATPTTATAAARPVRSRSVRPPSRCWAVAPPSSPADVPPDRANGVSGARTAHVAHSDSPQHSDGAGQEPISSVVDA